MKNLDKMVKISLLAAIGAMLMFIEIPMPGFTFLKLDSAEVPVLISGFAFGPIAGVITEGLKILIKALTNPTTSMGVGELSNFIVGSALVVPAAIIYKRSRTKKSAIIGLGVGIIVMVVVSIFSNVYLIMPAYINMMGIEAVNGLLGGSMTNYVVAGVIPFNIIKSVISAVITYIVYKRVSRYIRKETMMIETKKVS